MRQKYTFLQRRLAAKNQFSIKERSYQHQIIINIPKRNANTKILLPETRAKRKGSNAVKNIDPLPGRGYGYKEYHLGGSRERGVSNGLQKQFLKARENQTSMDELNNGPSVLICTLERVGDIKRTEEPSLSPHPRSSPETLQKAET